MNDNHILHKTLHSNPLTKVVKLKMRASGKENKQRQKFSPVGSKVVGLFGLNTIPEECREIIITEGEYDAMIAFQETGIPAISLPNGANNLPPSCLPWLEKFQTIYLWMDNDETGQG